MTFLNPFVLFGLAAAAIPILIHLLNKRKLRTIEFSTLTFLKELQKNKMRKITIRQWLLLLLRTLIIIFLVLAFSRPALKGNFGTIGSHATTSLLIILDNTASMDLHNEKGKYLDQAKERALQIVSLMQENDDAVILRLSDLPALTMETPSHDIQKLQSLIQETSISVAHRTIEDAVRAGSAIIQQSKNFNREVYVLTDEQLTTVRSEKKSNRKSETLFDSNVKFFFTKLSSVQHDNIGIERVTIPPSLLQMNRPVTVSTVIKNFGTSRIENHLVGISISGTRIMQKSISLDGGESGTLEFSFTPSHSGFITGFVDLEDDEFETDNKRYFSLYIPERISVTLIAADDAHARYISAALNSANTLAPSSFININRIAPAQISSTLVTASDVVILSGIKNISDQQTALLQSYVSSGGTLVFFPAADSSFESYKFLTQFGIPQFRVSSSQLPGIHFDKVDLEFPIFTGMFNEQQTKKITVESPNVLRSLSFPSTRNVRPIITLSNGSPFLWLAESGNGTLLGFSVPATDDWSDFPLKGIFVPLLNQSMIYLASQIQLEAQNKMYAAEEPIEFTSSQIKKSRNSSAANLRIVDPEHRLSPLKSYSKIMGNRTSQTMYTGEPVTNLGQHYVIADRDTVLAFSVNIHNDESDTKLADDDDIISTVETLGVSSNAVSIVSPEASLQETVMQSRFGIELWRYFALLAVLCAVIEMIAAREKKEL